MMNKSDIEDRIIFWSTQEYSHPVSTHIMLKMYSDMKKQVVCADCEKELMDDKIYFNSTVQLQCFDCWEAEYKRLSNKAKLHDEIFS